MKKSSKNLLQKKLENAEFMYDNLTLDHNKNYSNLLFCEEKIFSYEKEISDLKRRNRELFNWSLENLTSQLEISFLNDSIKRYRNRLISYSILFFAFGYILWLIISNLY